MPVRLSLVAIIAISILGCGEGGREVVVYTSHDQVLSEPILNLFEERTGINVLPVYDTEATKTTGLVQRLQAEADRPRCDVFWNNEIVQTMRLVGRGITQPHVSPSAETIPAALKDPDGHWTGFAARARVIVINTDLVEAGFQPATYGDIFQGPLADRAGLALPLFGTTATHFALIHSRLGGEGARQWLEGLQANGAQVLDSNGQICDAVSRGALAMGWTDTDDVAVAISEGQPVAQIIPTDGAILIPNTVVMIAGAPHPDEAHEFIDFLLSPEVEQLLAEGSGAQIPLHPGVPTPANVLSLDEVTFQEVDWANVANHFDAATDLASEMLTE